MEAITRDQIVDWIRRSAALIEENERWLTQLDADIGDADHGANMHRGFQAVLRKLPDVANSDIGSILKSVGLTLVSTVGGAGGPLYGTFFIDMGATTAGKKELSLAEWAVALEAGVAGMVRRGKAGVGDKTMLDALQPAVNSTSAAAASGSDIATALRVAAQAAEEGMRATTPLVARKGRASYLGERSAGHQDPGATSAALLLQAAAQTLSPEISG